MAKFHRNNVGSLALDHHDPATNATVGGHFRLWNALSASSFRRIIFDAVSCGGSSRYNNRYNEDDLSSSASTTTSASGRSKEKQEEQRQEASKSKRKPNARSEKLSDLLHMAESEIHAETKRKEEALEELKQIVMELQGEDLMKQQMAAANVRLLAKDNLEIRGTLAMLGVIPPLVGMLDLEDVNSQIASLYALLNLGIGNDA